MQLLINGISAYRAGHPIGPAHWPHYDLIVVLAGSVSLECGGQTLRLLAHDAILLPPDNAFRGNSDEGGGTIWVQHFQAKRSDLPARWRTARTPVVLPSAADSEIATALMRRIHALRDDGSPETAAVRAAHFRALCLELNRVSPGIATTARTPAPLDQAIRWAEANPAQALTLAVVAKEAGMSESHFRATFRRHRGRSAGQWLRHLRMGEARRLISSAGLSLKEISARMGFSDAVSFNRSFHRFHGQPPGKFRRGHPPTV